MAEFIDIISTPLYPPILGEGEGMMGDTPKPLAGSFLHLFLKELQVGATGQSPMQGKALTTDISGRHM